MEIKGAESAHHPKKAPESSYIKRVRGQVKDHIKEENKQIKAKALKEMANLNKQWRQRHAADRIDLKDRTYAQVKSSYVSHLREAIGQELKKSPHATTLKGRVSGGKPDKV